MENLRFTLIQCRNPHDPMREQEIQCFYQALNFPDSIVSDVNILAPIDPYANKVPAIAANYGEKAGRDGPSLLDDHDKPTFNHSPRAAPVS